MSIESELEVRSESKCELCSATGELTILAVEPCDSNDADTSILLCPTCTAQVQEPATADANHWRCLNDSMWSQVPAVQVMAWRMLNHLKDEGWPQDLLEMLFLDDDVLAWAKAGMPQEGDTIEHRDSNGALLANGDTVTLIKDLNVKGGGFTAKRGTAVRGIRLVADNAEHIEGRVNGQQIVILTQFVKKS